MQAVNSPNFQSLWLTLCYLMRTQSQIVQTERWQGVSTKKDPAAATHELLNVSVSVHLQGIVKLDHWRQDIQPNLPWADDHFEERVCGQPINPGTEWKNWPWGKSAERFLIDGKFNHNYMERYWPKYANKGAYEYPLEKPLASDLKYPPAHTGILKYPPAHTGIRNSYGDLGDLVELLAHEPYTRQAYLPIFFPEDTGIGDGGRKPCSLGYLFMMRNQQLHVQYYMRSCDFAKHFRDDVYLTVRLLIWVLDECTKRNRFWRFVGPGQFTMHIMSLHLFRNDYLTLFHKEGGQQ